MVTPATPSQPPPSNTRFGRIPQFDPRSRLFAISPTLPALPPRSYTWSCNQYLYQGYTSSCVGFSIAHEIVARPVALPMTRDQAMTIYREAQRIDPWPGESYLGTSILAGIKVAASQGYYSEYRWGFSLSDLQLAIGYRGPAVLGLNWYSGMMHPDSSGLIHPTGDNLGGHAILCNGISLSRKQFRLHNSWGSNWGLGGDCFISFDDMDRLLHEDGEACIPTKRIRLP